MTTALTTIAQTTGVSTEEISNVLTGMIISAKNQHGATATGAELAVVAGVCSKYGLNPLVKECAAFISGGKLQVIVMIDGYYSIVNRQPTYDGVKFKDQFDANGKITAITCEMYVKGRAHPVEVTEYLAECFDGKSSVWKKWPCRMLRHKAYIQAARMAFGFSELLDTDEVDRIKSNQPQNTPQIEVDFDAIDKEFSECGDDETLRQTAKACRENLEKLNAWESAKVQVAALRTKHKNRLEALIVGEVEADEIIDVEFAEVDESEAKEGAE